MTPKKKSTNQFTSLWILLLPFSFLLVAGLGCNLPEGLPLSTPAGPGANIYTSVAETLLVLENAPPQDGTVIGPDGTQSPQDADPSQEGGTSQIPPGAVSIYLSENTNCRTGQSTAFKRLTILMKGDEVEVVGRDSTGDYYYIRVPDQPTDFCWLWNAYATPSGTIESLPVFTSVPTATPEE